MAYQEYRVRIYKSGSEEWLNEKGQRHRLDGPAVIFANGDQAYLQDGRFHRLDGPAIIHTNGFQSYCHNGETHRLDGPAIIHPSGKQEWYLDGKQMTEEEHKRATNPVKEMTIREIEALLGHSIKIVK